jgi:tetrahydromethanopterin S-methyltransferase subunit A
VVPEDHLRDTGTYEMLDELDDRDAVGSAVDEVAEKDDRAIDPGTLDIAAKPLEERAKRAYLSVDVADHVDTIVEEPLR